MEYEKLTKAELIEKLEEKKHLAKAVEAKDKEIIGYIQTIKDLKEKLVEMEKASRDLIPKKELTDLRAEYAGSVKKDAIEGFTKALEQERDKAMKIANLYIKAYTDMLKQTQQNLDMALFTNELLEKNLK